MIRKKIGVLRGGPSSEYEVSLKTGASVLDALSDEKYDIFDITITRDGDWYLKGERKSPAEILSKIDLVFNAMHGEFGEDGKVQRILEIFNVPYTGSRTIASAMTMNKALAKKEFEKKGIKTPVYIELTKSDFDQKEAVCISEIFKTFPMPAVIKPIALGSSVGISIAKTGAELEKSLRDAFTISDKIIIEEYINGREATCGVIDGFRSADRIGEDKDFYTLLPVEIKTNNSFFDYDAKYGGQTEEICPGDFSMEEKQMIQKMTKEAHQALGLRHYSRSDFIISPRRGIYILETNSLPGLTQESLFPKSLKAVGSDLEEFVEHLIGLADN